MSKQSVSPNNWEPCVPGALSKYAATARSRRSRIFLGRSSVAVAATCLVLAVSYFGLRGDGAIKTEFKGGLGCSEVVENMDQFFAHELDSHYRAQIVQHLRDCPKCHRNYLLHVDASGTVIASNAAGQPRHDWATTILDSARQPLASSLLPVLDH